MSCGVRDQNVPLAGHEYDAYTNRFWFIDSGSLAG